jgi:pilus assembly protein CpaB
VSAIVTSEKRAIAVKVDKIIGVSGFIHPNNRVDVLVTLKNVAGLNFPVNKTILENVLVLAVGPDIERKGKEQKPNPVDVITLEVTPEEAEKLALASQEGKISLVLRKFGDSKEVLTTGQTTAGLLNSYSSGSVLPAASKRLVPATSGVSGASSKFISSKRNSVVTAKEKKKEEEKEKQKPIVVELIKGVKVTEVKIEGSL